MTTQQAPEFRFSSTWHSEDHIEYLPMRLYPGPNDTLVTQIGSRGFHNRVEAEQVLAEENERLARRIAEGESFLASDKVLPDQRAGFEESLAILRSTTFQVWQRTVSAATPV